MEQYRKYFPIFEKAAYINSCSYGALSVQVEGAYHEYLRDRHTKGADWMGWVDRHERVRGLFAELVGADAEEVAVTTSASAAMSSVASSLDFSGVRNKVVTTDLAFPTEAQIWHAQSARGAEVVHAREQGGVLDLQHFASLVDEKTLLVAVPLVCYRNGALTDIQAIIDIARKAGAMIMVDAYQGLGTMSVDVKALDIDFLAGGALKYLLASGGVGFLYVREDLYGKLTPTQTGWFAQADIHAMKIHANEPAPNARRFEQGTPPVPNLYAAEAGLKLLLEVGVAATRKHVQALNENLKEAVLEMGGTLASPINPNSHGAMVAVETTNEHELVARLATRGIVTSCRDGNLRVSAHFYNNAQDIAAVVDGLNANKELLA